MAKTEKEIKPISELTFDDFQRHPIWTWYENDEDESLIMPVKVTDPLREDDYGVFFILADIVLNDGTKLVGDISINLTNRQVYALKFYKRGKSFRFTGNYPVPLGTLSQLSEWLQKPIEAITPVRYITPFSFENGAAIVGEIELQDW